MKNNFTKLLLFAVFAIAIASCKSDDDDASSAGYLKVDGTSSDLSASSYLILDSDAGESPTGKAFYFHQINFVTTGLSLSGDDLVGNGSTAYLALTSDTENIKAGEYTYVGKENEPGEFAYGDVTLNISADEDGDVYDFVSGKVTVKVSGDTYTFDFEGKASLDGAASVDVTGHYQGKPTKISL